MGLVWGEEGRKTRQLIQRTERLAPDNPEVQESLARYHIFREEWIKGISVLHSFAEGHPNCPKGWYYYARWIFRFGNFQAAAEAIRKAYVWHPNDADIYRAACKIYPYSCELKELSPPVGQDTPATPEGWNV